MIVAIIQSRMSSSRLPGKALVEIASRPMLWHVVRRVQQNSKLIDQVIVATTDSVSDDSIAEFCNQEGIVYFRGSQHDVLDRYYQTANWAKAKVVVRITGDCPLIDATVVDQVIQCFLNSDVDYVSNVDPPTYPDGLDTEVFSCRALERAWNEARLPSEREHVTPYMRNQPKLFSKKNVVYKEDLSYLRWTVDEQKDLEFMRVLYSSLKTTAYSMVDILNHLKNHPEITKINAGIKRNEGYQISVQKDKFVN